MTPSSLRRAGAVAVAAEGIVASLRPAMPHCSSACRLQTPRKRERRDSMPNCAAIAANTSDQTNEKTPGNAAFQGFAAADVLPLYSTPWGHASSGVAAKEPIAFVRVIRLK